MSGVVSLTAGNLPATYRGRRPGGVARVTRDVLPRQSSATAVPGAGASSPSTSRLSTHSSASPGSAATTVTRKNVGQPNASTITPEAGPT